LIDRDPEFFGRSTNELFDELGIGRGMADIL
jgi:hypothetical protein